MARRRSSAPWRSHQTLEGRAAALRGAALARRDDGDDVLRRGPRRGLRVGEGPRQREPRARDEGLGRRHVADAADDARAEHERAVLGPQLEAVLARPRHAAGHPVRPPRRRHGARRQQRGRHELVALARLEGLEVLERDRAHGALRGRRGLEAGQGEGRHAEARLWAQAFPVSLLPKALPFASTTRALPETGPGAPKRLRAGSRAACGACPSNRPALRPPGPTAQT